LPDQWTLFNSLHLKYIKIIQRTSGLAGRTHAYVLCESEYNRGTGCGKTARPGLSGGRWVTGVPTARGFKVERVLTVVIPIVILVVFIGGTQNAKCENSNIN
jgi:hypothetical protein